MSGNWEWKICPGNSSISRTFGDLKSKIKINEKMSKWVICQPEVVQIWQGNLDFILLVSRSITRILENHIVVKIVWETIR